MKTRMKYTNCPTCGGLARYVSPNFEEAQILISAQNEKLEPYIKHLMQLSEQLQSMLEKKIEDYSSSDLYYLFITKVQKEVISEQVKIDTSYYLVNKSTKEFFDRQAKILLEGM